MRVFVALLRAVNVGGTGKLPMSDLKAMCVQLGFSRVQTYIASGNVLFESNDSEDKVKTALEKSLAAYAGKPVGVIVRTAAEMADVCKANPFLEMDGSRTVVIFLEQAPDANVLDAVKNQTNEELRPGAKEVFIYYPDGIGQSKLILPAAKSGTGRNMNTVKKLVDLANKLSK